MNKKILFVIATDQYFLSHRLAWAQAAQKAGFEVALATFFQGNHQEFIEQQGIQLFPLHFLRRGMTSPLYDSAALIELALIYHRYQPDLIHHVALKPIIFGSLVAKCQQWLWKKFPKKTKKSSMPALLNTFGGLGFVFTEKTFLRPVVGWLLRKALAHTTVIIQNESDQHALQQAGCTKAVDFHCIPGAGINIEDFTIETLPPTPPYRFVFIGRLLWTKGLGELVAAARILQRQHFPFYIEVWGLPDKENPEALSTTTLEEWQQAGLITLKGYCEDVNAAYAGAHVAVLPSYREGLPKSLLEAAACGRAIITTDAPGCREVVQDQKTGWLIPIKDPGALAQTMKESVEDLEKCEEMGLKGRQYVHTFFSNGPIQEAVLKVYEKIFHRA